MLDKGKDRMERVGEVAITLNSRAPPAPRPSLACKS
jgi:hypothetical protein